VAHRIPVLEAGWRWDSLQGKPGSNEPGFFAAMVIVIADTPHPPSISGLS